MNVTNAGIGNITGKCVNWIGKCVKRRRTTLT